MENLRERTELAHNKVEYQFTVFTEDAVAVACFHLQGFPSYSDVRLRHPPSPYVVEEQILLHRSDPSKNNPISGFDGRRSEPSKATVKS
ncbi:hypothetical protein BKA82DRAFT_1002675 [Pisolithus tinctorius]|uniref:Uncharacterized protein n=1 Tax=Pisolithus tinctorius Marx 270 TaxID=870435 RepID=A0A0C3P378_PISTI|nr:hypothetical protein BKA82DRAFT_1002675 [Pisolithus tinctorius]KIO01926.1 hypothetical protein M404DRAFT_1002675 [Pisolithus tinctorius Marx 270]